MVRSTRWFAALGMAIGVFATLPARGADDEKKIILQVGDKAPAFNLRTDSDKSWESSEHYGKKWVVIYFYPGDFTPGCTAQAKLFKEHMNKLSDLGVEVVGVSGDSVQTHEMFKKTQMLNFTLLSDEAGTAAKKFGVPFGAAGTARFKIDKEVVVFKRAGTASRWTFVVGKDGKIAYKNMKVDPVTDAKKITEFVRNVDKK
jgi:peroxiredoxin Q/BCP